MSSSVHYEVRCRFKNCAWYLYEATQSFTVRLQDDCFYEIDPDVVEERFREMLRSDYLIDPDNVIDESLEIYKVTTVIEKQEERIR